MIAAHGTEEFRRLWQTPGRQGGETLPGDVSRSIHWWETFSIQDQVPAECIALVAWRHGSPIREVVALVQYDEGEAVIQDFFVWPPFRKQGLARLLHDWIAERARCRGCKSLRFLVYDADTVFGDEEQTRFLTRCGYELERWPDGQVRIEATRPLSLTL